MAQDDWSAFPEVAPAAVGGAPRAGGVLTAPPKRVDPMKGREMELQEEEAARKREAAARETLEWDATHNPDGTPKAVAGAMTEDERKAAMQRGNLESLVSQINDVQAMFNAGQRENAIPILGSLWEYLPTPENRAFDAAASGVAEQAGSAFRVPGVGAQSDFEAKQMAEANKPSSWATDAENMQRLKQLRLRVDSTRASLGLPPAQWSGFEAKTTATEADNAPAAVVGSQPSGGAPPPPVGTAPPPLSEGADAVTAATGETRRVRDPELATQVDAMLRAGAPFSEINELAVSRGNAPLSPTQYAETVDFLKKNPGYEGSLVNAWKDEPLNDYDRFISGVVGDDATGLAGYAMGAGNFLSGNTLDNLSSDPERARQAMSVIEAESPTGTALGEISGGVMGAMLGEAGLARLGMAPGIVRSSLADTAMGTAQGAGAADDGNRLMGGATGGVTALGGGLAGNVVAKGVGRAISPTGGRMAELYGAGVRPTIGQRVANANDGRGVTGFLGRTVNTAEEALQSVPVVGTMIRGAREEARDQFQVGAFNEALKEVGEELPSGMRPGTDPHRYAQKAFERVYDDARSAMRMVPDEVLAGELSELGPDIAVLGPQAQLKLKNIMKNHVNNRIVDGAMTGEGYKKTVSDLGKQIARFRKGQTAEDQALADVLEGVQTSIDNAARRASDPEAVALLDAADAGYAKFVRIEDAARRRGGEAGTFTPAQFDAAVQNTSGGVRSKAYLRGDALMQDFANAGKGLSDTLPNSGTADRVMAGYAVGTPVAGAAMYAEPVTATILGTIATAYAPGVRKVVKGAIAPRGPKAKAIRERLEKRARLIGRVGAASAVAALPGTSPSQ